MKEIQKNWDQFLLENKVSRSVDRLKQRYDKNIDKGVTQVNKTIDRLDKKIAIADKIIDDISNAENDIISAIGVDPREGFMNMINGAARLVMLAKVSAAFYDMCERYGKTAKNKSLLSELETTLPWKINHKAFIALENLINPKLNGFYHSELMTLRKGLHQDAQNDVINFFTTTVKTVLKAIATGIVGVVKSAKELNDITEEALESEICGLLKKEGLDLCGRIKAEKEAAEIEAFEDVVRYGLSKVDIKKAAFFWVVAEGVWWWVKRKGIRKVGLMLFGTASIGAFVSAASTIVLGLWTKTQWNSASREFADNLLNQEELAGWRLYQKKSTYGQLAKGADPGLDVDRLKKAGVPTDTDYMKRMQMQLSDKPSK
tara:strand:+ start:3152 stop:4270 length:1119 start_codon:yes stop_codon:yes gene_type:complete